MIRGLKASLRCQGAQPRRLRSTLSSLLRPRSCHWTSSARFERSGSSPENGTVPKGVSPLGHYPSASFCRVGRRDTQAQTRRVIGPLAHFPPEQPPQPPKPLLLGQTDVDRPGVTLPSGSFFWRLRLLMPKFWTGSSGLQRKRQQRESRRSSPRRVQHCLTIHWRASIVGPSPRWAQRCLTVQWCGSILGSMAATSETFMVRCHD
jgi:hypothetical protein